MSEAEFLLIHGSCHGAWCWHRLIPALAERGHRARAIDLPRHPGVSLQDQAGAILAALPRPAILLGHSAGGLPITAAAETDPARIRALVWLCAFIPHDGASVASLRRAQSRQPLPPAIRVAGDSYSFAPDRLRDLFYHDCSDEDYALAARNLCPEPIAPQETPLRVSARSQDLPHFALLCEEDRAIPPEAQEEMARTIPPANRFRLDCGHSPFFARPQETAAMLAEIAARLR
ncbi:alpha/beta fold hydrolase [Pseudogemmobacter humi]|uniref:Pyrethroid hydrolase n=1 Tax=Pseudogemmobacter humi TaxID=2483812 RepID=A0A3P5XTJ5_9RHOB|nr:alpha/beta fold hydrolase [Pseudogemmobacter humi]VDC31340.1 Pyrethroid hydrolase [Pseudogemmobacter humi]